MPAPPLPAPWSPIPSSYGRRKYRTIGRLLVESSTIVAPQSAQPAYRKLPGRRSHRRLEGLAGPSSYAKETGRAIIHRGKEIAASVGLAARVGAKDVEENDRVAADARRDRP